MGDRHLRQRDTDVLHGQIPQRDPPDHREHPVVLTWYFIVELRGFDP